jgi:hypothetical protein
VIGSETALTGLLNPMTLQERAKFLARFALAFGKVGGKMKLSPARAVRRPWEETVERYVGDDEK